MKWRYLVAALTLASILAMAGCSGTKGNVALTTGLPATGFFLEATRASGGDIPLPDVSIAFSITLTPLGGGPSVEFFNDAISIQEFIDGHTYYLTVLEGTYDTANISITRIEVNGVEMLTEPVAFSVPLDPAMIIPPLGTEPVPISFIWTGCDTADYDGFILE